MELVVFHPNFRSGLDGSFEETSGLESFCLKNCDWKLQVFFCFCDWKGSFFVNPWKDCAPKDTESYVKAMLEAR